LPPGHTNDELRTEAIAALMLPDLEVAKEFNGWPEGTSACTIDRAFQRYARADMKGNVSIRRLEDDVELLRLPGTGGEVESYFGLKFSPDGRFLHHRCVKGAAGLSRLWKLDGAKPTAIAEGYWHVAFEPDCSRAAITHEDGAVQIIELPSGKEQT